VTSAFTAHLPEGSLISINYGATPKTVNRLPRQDKNDAVIDKTPRDRGRGAFPDIKPAKLELLNDGKVRQFSLFYAASNPIGGGISFSREMLGPTGRKELQCSKL
jgi:hypothetical protein